MPRSTWSGTISFGLVSVPVKVYTSTDKKQRVSFNQLHRKCGQRIRELKHCPLCEENLTTEDIIKGFQVAKDQYVPFNDTDMASLPLKTMKTIEIAEFVRGEEIDLRAYDEPYFLAPEDTGLRAFRLLAEAMEELGVVAIAKISMRNREHLVCLRPYQGVMLLHTLYYADELRSVEEVRPKLKVELSEKERNLAKALIQEMMAKFDHSKYTDEYREAVLQLVDAKLRGEVITVEERKAPEVSLVEALSASLKKGG